MNSVVLRIVSWDSALAWSSDVAWVRTTLIHQLRECTPIGHIEAKRLIRGLLEDRTGEILLVRPAGVNSMRHVLESLGAVVELVEVTSD